MTNRTCQCKNSWAPLNYECLCNMIEVFSEEKLWLDFTKICFKGLINYMLRIGSGNGLASKEVTSH